MKKAILMASIVALAIGTTACSSMKFEGSQSNNGVKAYTPEDEVKYPPYHNSQTVFVCSYSCIREKPLALPWDEEWNNKKCIKGYGLERVEVHSNFFYSLIGVCTLGFLIPEGVEWARQDIVPAEGPQTSAQAPSKQEASNAN